MRAGRREKGTSLMVTVSESHFHNSPIPHALEEEVSLLGPESQLMEVTTCTLSRPSF